MERTMGAMGLQDSRDRKKLSKEEKIRKTKREKKGTEKHIKEWSGKESMDTKHTEKQSRISDGKDVQKVLPRIPKKPKDVCFVLPKITPSILTQMRLIYMAID